MRQRLRSASLRTSGLIASAKKRAAPIIRRPVAAWAIRKPAAAKPRMTSQKRIKVFVSTVTLYVLLMVIFYHKFFHEVVEAIVEDALADLFANADNETFVMNTGESFAGNLVNFIKMV